MRKSGHIKHERLIDLVGLIYRAAAGQAEWEDLLVDIADLYQGTAVLFRHDYEAGRVPFAFDSGLDPDMVASYKAHYGRLNPIVQAQETMSAGTVILGHELIPERELIRSEYYNDWMKPQDLHFGLGSNILREKSWALKLGIMRPRRKGPYCAGDMHVFHRLMPHLQSAFRLHEQLTQLEHRNEALRLAVEHLNVGIVFLDSDGYAVEMNSAAEAHFAAHDGLSIYLGAVRCDSARHEAMLRPMIMGAVKGTGAGGVLSVPRPSGHLPYSVLITPLPKGVVEYPSDVAAILFLGDPEREIVDDENIFGALYGLTPAEVRLTGCLVNGLSIKEAAERLGVTENTARCVSKRIFSKTGVRRQSELMRLLFNSVAILRRHQSR